MDCPTSQSGSSFSSHCCSVTLNWRRPISCPPLPLAFSPKIWMNGFVKEVFLCYSGPERLNGTNISCCSDWFTERGGKSNSFNLGRPTTCQSRCFPENDIFHNLIKLIRKKNDPLSHAVDFTWSVPLIWFELQWFLSIHSWIFNVQFIF